MPPSSTMSQPSGHQIPRKSKKSKFVGPVIHKTPRKKRDPFTTGMAITEKPKVLKPPTFWKPQTFVSITVTTAPDTQVFTIHKDVISHYSPFFQAAFASTLLEGQTQCMDLPDIDANTFGIFVNWLYNQTLEQEAEQPIPLVQLAKLWAHAECWLMPRLQNQVMKLIYGQVRPMLINSSDFKQFILAAHGANSMPLERLIVGKFLVYCHGSPAWTEGFLNALVGMFPEKMLPDLLKGLMQTCNSLSHDLGPSTDYYVEEEDEKKKS